MEERGYSSVGCTISRTCLTNPQILLKSPRPRKEFSIIEHLPFLSASIGEPLENISIDTLPRWALATLRRKSRDWHANC